MDITYPNFCVEGGCPGWMCNGDAWGQRHAVLNCANCRICGIFGSDFGFSVVVLELKLEQLLVDVLAPTSWTGCRYRNLHAPTQTNEAWCPWMFINWSAGGGVPVHISYCNNWAKCCAGGSGQGGSGIVKITFA